MTPPIRLRPARARDWDAVVAAHPAGTPFHLAGFLTTVGRCLGLQVHLTLAEADGEVIGAVPLLVRSVGPLALVNHRLPFPYLGPLLSPGYGPESVLPAVRRYLRPQPVLSLAVQSVDPFPAPAGPGWTYDPGYDSSVMTVAGKDDDELMAMLSSNRRTRLRRALRRGVTAGPATREELVEHLPRWSAEAFERQGLPPRWPDGAHAALYDALAPTGVVLSSAVRQGDQLLLVSFDLLFGDRLIGWEIGNSAAGRAADATLVLYLHLARRARDAGAGLVDLLGSPNENIAEFKRSIGAAPRPRGMARWDSPLLPVGKRLVRQHWLRPVVGATS